MTKVTVTCIDGKVRHYEPFPNMAKAKEWAEWGHICASEHTYHEIDPLAPLPDAFPSESAAVQTWIDGDAVLCGHCHQRLTRQSGHWLHVRAPDGAWHVAEPHITQQEDDTFPTEAAAIEAWVHGQRITCGTCGETIARFLGGWVHMDGIRRDEASDHDPAPHTQQEG